MRVALMHSNDELADQLSKAVNQYTDWTADPHSAAVDGQPPKSKVERIRAVANGDYDVIQADELVGNGPAAQMLGTVKQTPVVGYLRGWGDYTNDHGQYGLNLRTKLRIKTGVLTRTMNGMAAISHAVVGGMTDMYPMHDTQVIERPYNVEYYGSGESGLFDRTTVLTVTNLRYKEKYEGVITVIEGLRPILEDSDVQYAIAGDGRYLDQLRDYVQQYPYREQVQVLGYRDDVPDLLASADVFAYVSFLDGAPSTVYEAQCAGLPVIGGDAAGVPEAVGDAGAVVPPTPQGVYRGVDTVLSDSEYRQELATKSREKMERHNERVATEWVDFWRGVV